MSHKNETPPAVLKHAGCLGRTMRLGNDSGRCENLWIDVHRSREEAFRGSGPEGLVRRPLIRRRIQPSDLTRKTLDCNPHRLITGARFSHKGTKGLEPKVGIELELPSRT